MIGWGSVADPDSDGEGARSSLETHLGQYLRDESLWPVAVAASAIAVTLGAALFAATWRTGNLLLGLAVALLALISADVLQRQLRRRRLGLLGGGLLLWWLASAGAAGTHPLRRLAAPGSIVGIPRYSMAQPPL